MRTVSFLTDHQLELGIRALQAARLIDQAPTFWLMQGSISADSFGHYRLELAVDLTEEEGDHMVHQLAGLGDRAESPPGLEYWERDGDLGPEYDEVVEQFYFDQYLLPHLEWCQYTALSGLASFEVC